MSVVFPEGSALIVGSSGGIGQAVAQRIAEYGCDVALAYHRNAKAAEALADDLQQHGRIAKCFPLDLAHPHEIQDHINHIAHQTNGIHTLIYAAGPSIAMTYLAQTEWSEMERVLRTDASGFFGLIKATLPHLKNYEASALVAVTSAGVKRYPPKDGLSVAPKAAIEAMVKGIAREEGRFGVRANSVALGVIDAGMFKRLEGQQLDATWLQRAQENIALKRFGTAREVANAVTFLASDEASYITGQTIHIDGGYTI